MSRVIELADGEVCTVFDLGSCLKLIREKMGDELGDYLEQGIREMIDTIRDYREFYEDEEDIYGY